MQHPAQGAHQVRCTLLTRSLTKKARGRIIYARRNCLSARGGTTRSVAGAPQRPLAYSCRRLKKMQGRSSSPVPLLNDSVNVLLDTLGGNAKRYCAHAPARRRMLARAIRARAVCGLARSRDRRARQCVRHGRSSYRDASLACACGRHPPPPSPLMRQLRLAEPSEFSSPPPPPRAPRPRTPTGAGTSDQGRGGVVDAGRRSPLEPPSRHDIPALPGGAHQTAAGAGGGGWEECTCLDRRANTSGCQMRVPPAGDRVRGLGEKHRRAWECPPCLLMRCLPHLLATLPTPPCRTQPPPLAILICNTWPRA